MGLLFTNRKEREAVKYGERTCLAYIHSYSCVLCLHRTGGLLNMLRTSMPAAATQLQTPWCCLQVCQPTLIACCAVQWKFVFHESTTNTITHCSICCCAQATCLSLRTQWSHSCGSLVCLSPFARVRVCMCAVLVCPCLTHGVHVCCAGLSMSDPWCACVLCWSVHV